MRHYRYISDSKKETLTLKDLLTLNNERELINKAKSDFLEFAEEIPGYINKVWIKRNLKEFRGYQKRYRQLEEKYGLHLIMYILVSNTSSKYLHFKTFKDYITSLRRWYFNNLKDTEVDSRFLFSEHHEVFWESLIHVYRATMKGPVDLFDGIHFTIAESSYGKGKRAIIKGQVLLALFSTSYIPILINNEIKNIF